MNTREIRTIVGIIGTVFHYLFSLAKLPMLVKIFEKERDELPDNRAVHYVKMSKYCFWILYGLSYAPKDNILITTNNVLGYATELIFHCLVFSYYKNNLNFKLEDIVVILIFDAIIAPWFYGFLIFVPDEPDPFIRHIFIGTFCNFFTIFDYYSPLAMIRYTYMPAWILLGNIVDSGIWITFSFIYKFDLYLFISYGVGILLCVIQWRQNVRYDRSNGNVIAIDSQLTLQQHQRV